MQRVDEVRDGLLVAAQQLLDRRQRLRVGDIGRLDVVLETAAAGQVGDQRRRQQRAVLHHVDAAVGEAALVAQPDDVEFDVLVGVAAVDEVHRQRAGRQIARCGVRLAATNDCAIICPPNVRSGFLLGCDPTKTSSSHLVQVEHRQQLVEVETPAQPESSWR